MAKQDKTDPAETHEERVEETEPLADEDLDTPGIPGQIQYPDPQIDAERAAAFAAGKEEYLNPEDEGDETKRGWQNPADRPTEEQTDEDEEEEEEEEK